MSAAASACGSSPNGRQWRSMALGPGLGAALLRMRPWSSASAPAAETCSKISSAISPSPINSAAERCRGRHACRAQHADRAGGHRHRLAGDAGLVRTRLAAAIGRLRMRSSSGPLMPACCAQLLQLLDLAQHLRLADDLAFERGGDARRRSAAPPGRSAHAGAARSPPRLEAAGLGQQAGQLRLRGGRRPAPRTRPRSGRRSTTAIAWSMPLSRQRPSSRSTSPGVAMQRVAQHLRRRCGD